MKVDFDKVIDRHGTYCTQWDYIKDRFGKDDLIPFTISDMDFESPKEIIDILEKRISHKIFGYSRWNHDDYKCSIKNWYKKRFKFDLNCEFITYSPTVIYSVAKFINILSNVGDGILLQTPAYDAFFKVIKENSRNIIENKLIYFDGKYEIDFDDFEKKLTFSKIFLLCSPHNPTGRVWTKEELEKIIFLCKKKNVKIISDEIHMDIVYSPSQHIPILKIANDYENNIVLCTSSSKSFNTPSLGGAYNIIPSGKLRESYLNVLKNAEGLSSPNIFGIMATIVAYNECEYWLDELNNYLFENLNFVKTFLKEHVNQMEFNIPEGSYFAWIDFSKLNISSEKLQKALIEFGKVAIMPGITYGTEGENFIRLNVACPREKLLKGLNGIKKAIENLK